MVVKGATHYKLKELAQEEMNTTGSEHRTVVLKVIHVHRSFHCQNIIKLIFYINKLRLKLSFLLSKEILAKQTKPKQALQHILGSLTESQGQPTQQDETNHMYKSLECYF